MNRQAAQDSTAIDYRAIFSEQPGLYLILNPELIIVSATKAFLRASGTTSEIIGKKIFDVFPDSDDNHHQGASALRRSLGRVIQDHVEDGMALQRYDVSNPDGQFQ